MNARLQGILRYRRAADSIGEQCMIDEQIMPYEPALFHSPEGEVLAHYISIDGENSRTLFSCHTDTVHHDGRPHKRFEVVASSISNPIRFDEASNTVHATDDCLGADDGAGVWLLLEMIAAGVPGHYLFHRAEECGGIGSRGMTTHHREFLHQFDRAVAFDRKATHSVITHQRSGRCCSDTFAETLADRLTGDTYFFAPDATGIFTDTDNYSGIIPECTNVSVGYYNEHTPTEYLDITFLEFLREQCIALDWEGLPTERNPLVIEPRFSAWQAYHDDFSPSDPAELFAMSQADLADFIYDYPDEAAQLVFELLHGDEGADDYELAQLRAQREN